MSIPITNFGLVTVSTTYGSGSTSIALTSGHGARLPATTGGYRYSLTWWDSTNYPHPADDPNKEIVLVTARSGDTLTVTRGQDGTSASTKNTGSATYRMNLGLTKAMWDDASQVKSVHEGLVLQTHRSSSSAASIVELVDCEYIAMNDGTILRNDAGEWTGKSADITVSGAGGRDSGAEEGSTWYEIHAIAKEDGTRNLILRKANEWRVDTSYVSGADSYQSIRAASGNTKVSQGFQLLDTCILINFVAYLKRVGSPTGTMTMTITANSAGVPGSTLQTSYILDVSKIPTTDTPVAFTFPITSSALTGSTQYHAVIEGTWTINGTDYIAWKLDGSAGAYAGGSKALYNGTSWTADSDDDLYFETYARYDFSSLTLPTDYTKSRLLGWVRNDVASDFVPFVQHGRSYSFSRLNSDDCAVSACNGTAQFVMMSEFLPPMTMCTAVLGIGGTGTQAGLAAIGDLRATDLSSAGDTTGTQAVLYSGVTSTRPAGFRDVLIERNCFMAYGTTGAIIWISGFKW